MPMPKQTAREKVIQASQQLMVAQGYTATTVDEIVEAAGVAKGSFYHAFKSKEELALAALDDYFQHGMTIIAGGAYVDEQDPVKKVFAFLDHVNDKACELWEHGCLLGSMSIELADNYPNLIARIDSLFWGTGAGPQGKGCEDALGPGAGQTPDCCVGGFDHHEQIASRCEKFACRNQSLPALSGWPARLNNFLPNLRLTSQYNCKYEEKSDEYSNRGR